MPFDFDSNSFLSLTQVNSSELEWLPETLFGEERALLSLKSVRDSVCFTNFRIILRNAQGVTGVKVALSTIPYESITSYSIIGAGPFELSIVLRLFIRDAGELKLELIRNSDVKIFDGLLARAIIQRTK